MTGFYEAIDLFKCEIFWCMYVDCKAREKTDKICSWVVFGFSVAADEILTII